MLRATAPGSNFQGIANQQVNLCKNAAVRIPAAERMRVPRDRKTLIRKILNWLAFVPAFAAPGMDWCAAAAFAA
jgi:hypothetical protein